MICKSIFIGLATLAGVGSFAGETNVAAKIELKDQFSQMHVVAFPREKLSVLTIADKPGSTQLESWVKPIRQKFGELVEIFGLADVAGVPKFIRPLIVNHFKENVEYPVMLDWDGAAVASYGYVRKKALVLVIDRQGAIKHRVTGAADDAKLAAVFALLKEDGKDGK